LPYLTNAANGVISSVVDFWDRTWQWISGTFTYLANALKTAFGPVMDWIVSHFKSAFDYAKGILNNVSLGGGGVGSISESEARKLTEGGSNSLIAKIIGMAEGNRTASGGYTSAARGHVDPGNGAFNIGSFSAQGALNDGTIDGSDRRVIEQLIKPRISKLYKAAQAAGVAVTIPLLLNYLDLANQAPLAADGDSRGPGFLGQIARLKGRESDQAAIAKLRVDAFRTNDGRLSTTFASEADLYRDQKRRMDELLAAQTAYAAQLPKAQTSLVGDLKNFAGGVLRGVSNIVTPPSSTVLKVSRTGQKDSQGLEILRMDLVDRTTGRVIDSVLGNSGVRSTQKFDLQTSKYAQQGSLAPIPTGTFRIGKTTSSNDPGIGGWFVPLDGSGDNVQGRGAFGIHMDANRAYSPGSAGCIVLYDPAAKARVQQWLANANAPRELTVRYGIGGGGGGGTNANVAIDPSNVTIKAGDQSILLSDVESAGEQSYEKVMAIVRSLFVQLTNRYRPLNFGSLDSRTILPSYLGTFNQTAQDGLPGFDAQIVNQGRRTASIYDRLNANSLYKDSGLQGSQYSTNSFRSGAALDLTGTAITRPLESSASSSTFGGGSTKTVRFQFDGLDETKLYSAQQIQRLESYINDPDFADMLIETAVQRLRFDQRTRSLIGFR
jgi:hypothetical protein